MKTLSGLTKCGLVGIAAFCFSASECDLKHNVVFLPDYATADQIVLPGTALTEEDAAKLREALKNSDPNFYTIQAWINGVKDGQPFGKLPFPKCLDVHRFAHGQGEEGFKTGISRSPPLAHGQGEEGFKTGISRTNASRWSRVIGQGCQSRCTSNIGRHGRRRDQGSLDLVNTVKPVLLKYQKE
jgi:hypothetical protein